MGQPPPARVHPCTPDCVKAEVSLEDLPPILPVLAEAGQDDLIGIFPACLSVIPKQDDICFQGAPRSLVMCTIIKQEVQAHLTGNREGGEAKNSTAKLPAETPTRPLLRLLVLTYMTCNGL